LRSRRDDDHPKGALGDQRGYVHLGIIDVVIDDYRWVIVWIAEEADGFFERGLRVSSIRRSNVIDDIGLNALPCAPVYKEYEFKPATILDML
jgi:hypothetical protein